MSQTENIGFILLTFMHDTTWVFDNKLRQPDQFVHIFKWVKEKFQIVHHVFKLDEANVMFMIEL